MRWSREVQALVPLMVLLMVPACRETAEEPLTGPTWRAAETSSSATVLTYKRPVQERTATEIIDHRGGRIEVYDHVLKVPNGAVQEATRFEMRALGGEYVVFEMTAERVRDGAPVTHFDKSLKFKLSYKEVSIDDPNRLAILYLADGTVDGNKVPIKSEVDIPKQRVNGKVDHFSQYAMGMN